MKKNKMTKTKKKNSDSYKTVAHNACIKYHFYKGNGTMKCNCVNVHVHVILMIPMKINEKPSSVNLIN